MQSTGLAELGAQVLGLYERNGVPGQISLVLLEGREAGLSFEHAWLNAIKAILPPRTCSDGALVADIQESRRLLHEVKPYFRAAYEGRSTAHRDVKRHAPLAVKKAETLANRRLNRLLRVEQMTIAA